MERVKRVVCILVCLCSAVVACNGNDPIGGKRGRRAVAPRLSDARWQVCCREAKITSSCNKTITNRDRALELLVDAHGDCLDRVVAAVEKYAKDDLSAAYFLRAQRKNDPVDFLRALRAAEETRQRDPKSVAALFNRALAQEKLGLTTDAIRSWDDVVKNDRSAWGEEAAKRRDALMRTSDPTWNPAELEDALRARNRETLARIARAFPADAERYFETSNLLDLEASRVFADVLGKGGDAYPRNVVAGMEKTKDRKALERGLEAFRAKDYARAALLLEHAGNPLHLSARYGIARSQFIESQDSLSVLDTISAHDTYRDLSFRVHNLRAGALEQQGSYVEALHSYERALGFAHGDPTITAATLSRRSGNYRTIGLPEEAFKDAFTAVRLLPRVADVNTRLNTYGSAATAAHDLGFPDVALQYLTAAVGTTSKAAAAASPDRLASAKQFLAIALRARADAYTSLGREGDAAKDLDEASRLAEAVGDQSTAALLRMRIHEVRGHLLMQSNPPEAIAELTRAITLAEQQNSTYRANLHFKRGTARRKARLPGGDEDFAEAFRILREEAKHLLDSTKRGEYEQLSRPYFSRFQQLQHELIDSLVRAQDVEGAFVQTELARAFEPMQLLLQSESVPRGFRRIESVKDLRQQLANLPDDTVILQYAVLEKKTYVWVLTRTSILLVPLRPGRETIQRWVGELNRLLQHKQREPFPGALVAPHEELFRVPLALPAAAARKRLVIVPDGPMHALPFAALNGASDKRFLIERYSIAVAGSTSLYLFALQRNAQLPRGSAPAVLIIGDPTVDPAIGARLNLKALTYAREEATQLGHDYPRAKILLGADATPRAFLDAAKSANIIHFAGHGVASPQSPWNSMLVLARDGRDSGELTAARLMSEVPRLEATRLVVLAACSSASGQTVGPEGIAPLVRPLIAANVPAVVGTLWDVNDATAKNLMVSLHCHYRNGDDVAVALQKAQLEMLRKKPTAMGWVPFQAAGYAASPYAHRGPMEKTQNADVCTENSLHRPHGLRSQ